MFCFVFFVFFVRESFQILLFAVNRKCSRSECVSFCLHICLWETLAKGTAVAESCLPVVSQQADWKIFPTFYGLYVRLDLISWMSFFKNVYIPMHARTAPITMRTKASLFVAVNRLSTSWRSRIKPQIVPLVKPLSPCFPPFVLVFLSREPLRCCWTQSSTQASWRTMCAHQGAPPSTPCMSWRAEASAASWSTPWRLRAFGHGETVAPVNPKSTWHRQQGGFLSCSSPTAEISCQGARDYFIFLTSLLCIF